MNILLTGEEIARAIVNGTDFEWVDIDLDSGDFAIARAQLRKVVEYLSEVGSNDGLAWCIFNTDWAALKQEVGE